MTRLKLKIVGMSCDHCVRTVKSSIEKLNGVKGVSVNLRKQSAVVKGDVSLDTVKEAVAAAGYKVDD
ncbi:MAG: heavy-metal-associated domain-containing protein [Spirochaetales bacterium]|nr:heavy-metal-associated domain-containing protein [Spirochaetales bacterium]